MPPLNCTPVALPSGRTTQDARTPLSSAVYMPAGAGTAGALNLKATPFIVRSPTTSLPLNSARSVSLKRDVMSIFPSFWLPKNHASSSVPLQAYAAISVPSTAIPMTIGLPSGDLVSAMYFADCGNGDAVAGAGVAEVREAWGDSVVP